MTIESVASQSVAPYEFIIIDGASTDGSALLLSEFSSILSYSVSEPDDGIYNAMNKGVSFATGDYCLFLNAGDTLCSEDVISQVLKTSIHSDIFCGNAIILEEIPRRKSPPKDITMRYLFGSSLCHQAVFIKTDLLRRCPYDESLKIVSDRKFFLENLILRNCSYDAVNIDICNYDITGYSANNRFASQREWQGVLKDLIPERILNDYGLYFSGPLYGTSDYDSLFVEIRQRRWRKPVYRSVWLFLKFMSFFIPSARFVKVFQSHVD